MEELEEQNGYLGACERGCRVFLNTFSLHQVIKDKLEHLWCH